MPELEIADVIRAGSCAVGGIKIRREGTRGRLSFRTTVVVEVGVCVVAETSPPSSSSSEVACAA